MSRRPDTLAYLGWQGNGNMGDEALLAACREALPPGSVTLLPRSRSEVARFVKVAARRFPIRPHLLLGGGTFIGSAWWRTLITRTRPLAPGRPAFMVSSGVVGPKRDRSNVDAVTSELNAWAPILSRFDRITVRGPLSVALLTDIGFDARVIGDPALLLGPARAPDETSVEDQVIGVNVGFGEDLWGHDQERVIDAVVDAVGSFTARTRGWRVHLIGVNDTDAPSLHQCRSKLVERGVVVSFTMATQPEAFLEAVEGCTVIIGERLHAVVLASTLGIPAVMLAYNFKCLDFMASIDRSAWALGTDEVESQSIEEMLTSLVDDRPLHVKAISTAVDGLRGLLNEECAHISEAISHAG